MNTAAVWLVLVADLGIIYIMLVLQTFKMQELWSHGEFHKEMRSQLGMSITVWQSWSPRQQLSSWQCVGNMRVKQNPYWRPQQEVIEYSQPQSVGTWAAVSESVGAGLPEPLGFHTLPLCVPDARCADVGFNVCPASF